ncbi:hypothetical protein jhhlp_008619 [Lomentospora prolificans]|uniref:DNA-directed RNA polymerase III RPC4 n=1 Tax=Lomentospora prolificans TaxID=41688 RepID=A0A2N3MYJ4_9PEZI|nr:hypothetical protein jhhlp_008619 [Lomentospora prolificans]
MPSVAATPHAESPALSSAEQAQSQPTVAAATRGTSKPVASSSRGRLRPKVVRRNEEEREKLAQQEAKKDSERAAEERKLRGRVRFRGRRGRGNQFNTTGQRISKAEPSALFADQKGFASSSRGGFGFGGGRGGFGAGGVGRGRGGHNFDSIERPWEMRINADKLGSSTPSSRDAENAEEEEMTFMAVNSQPGPKPLGISRKEVKDPEMVVVTTAELEAHLREDDDNNLWVGESPRSPAPVPEADDNVWSAAPQGHVRVKTEDGELRSFMPSPGTVDFDSMRNIPLPEGADSAGLEDTAADSKPVSVADLDIPKAAHKTQRSGAPLTEEDEWRQDSYQYVLQTLAASSLHDGPSKEGDGEEEAAAALNDPIPFLCKFGPIMPPLRPKARPEPQVKSEPSDTVMLDQPPADLTADTAHANTDDTDGTDQGPSKHSGFIGKLVIRKSGRAELDYGGIRYQMSRGIKSSGVTSYMVLEELETKKPGQDEYAGRAIAMGTLHGKFNFGPIYNEQKDWVVSEEDLKVPLSDDA